MKQMKKVLKKVLILLMKKEEKTEEAFENPRKGEAAAVKAVEALKMNIGSSCLRTCSECE